MTKCKIRKEEVPFYTFNWRMLQNKPPSLSLEEAGGPHFEAQASSNKHD